MRCDTCGRTQPPDDECVWCWEPPATIPALPSDSLPAATEPTNEATTPETPPVALQAICVARQFINDAKEKKG